jgi:hypothetical protein
MVSGLFAGLRFTIMFRLNCRQGCLRSQAISVVGVREHRLAHN